MMSRPAESDLVAPPAKGVAGSRVGRLGDEEKDEQKHRAMLEANEGKSNRKRGQTRSEERLRHRQPLVLV